MAEWTGPGRSFVLIVVPPKNKGMTYFQSCFATEPKGNPGLMEVYIKQLFQGRLEFFVKKSPKHFLRKKRWGKLTKQPKGEKSMIKRLALLICCILLLPTIAASADGSTNYGDFWVGGQVGGLFADHTEPAVTAGAIVGYNFCLPYRQSWERYFGVALDFQWNKFNQRYFPDIKIKGDQLALSLLARVQYPLMGDESFTRGRLVPFLMFGPAVVWSERDLTIADDRTDFGVVAETGLEYFIIPQLSIGPSFRFRHVWLLAGRDQYMVLGRLAYHF